MTDLHRLAEVRKTSGNSVTAYCLCGWHTSHHERGTAVALVYKHTIDRAHPCPTPSKTRYGTRFEAENAIRNFWRTPSPGPRPIRAYRCPSGQHWHTTKHAYRERRAA